MRLIDADALIPLIQEERIEGEILDIIKALGEGLQAETLNQACDRHIKIISSSPTIDAVAVVRCEDCKHWNEDECQCERPELSGNRFRAPKYFDTYPDDHCSYGERAEG